MTSTRNCGLPRLPEGLLLDQEIRSPRPLPETLGIAGGIRHDNDPMK
jgi:hypothetical protein